MEEPSPRTLDMSAGECVTMDTLPTLELMSLRREKIDS